MAKQDDDSAAALLRGYYLMYRSITLGCDPRKDRLSVQFDGGVDRRGVRRRAVWPALAQFGIANKFNFNNWVATLFRLNAIFARSEDRYPVPRPVDLKDPRVLRLMQDPDARQNRLKSIDHAFASEIRIVEAEMAILRRFLPQKTDSELMGFVAQNTLLSLSRLMRWALGKSIPDPKLADKYWKPAVLQYSEAPEVYDRHLDDTCKASIKAAVARVQSVAQSLPCKPEGR